MTESRIDWETRTIGELVTHETAGVDPSDANGMSYVGLEHIEPREMSLNRWGDATTVRSRKTLFERGDILYGKLRPYLDKAVLVGRPGISSTDILVLRPTAGVDPYYMTALLHTRPFVAHAMATTAGVNHPRTSWPAISEYEVRVPPLSEQRAIADVLRSVQRAKEATDQVIAAARELKRSLMQNLFASAEWKVRPLGDVARIERGKFSHRPRNDPAFYGGDVPFVQTGDVAEAGGRLTIYRQTLNEAGLAVSRVFPAETIVITIAANIGHVAILEFDSAFPDSLIGITPTDQLSNEFLNYYLMTQQPEMDRLAPRGTQKNINIQFLKPWPVPVPPREEQEEIASTLMVVDRKIAAEVAGRDALGTMFDSLLHDLMSARLRVADLIPEVA